MKPMPVFVLMFLVAVIATGVAAQSSSVKGGKGNTKTDSYMTNEFYQTKPLTADSKGEKGAGKKSKHHIERIRAGKHNGSGPPVSSDAKPEPERSRLGQNTFRHRLFFRNRGHCLRLISKQCNLRQGDK